MGIRIYLITAAAATPLVTAAVAQSPPAQQQGSSGLTPPGAMPPASIAATPKVPSQQNSGFGVSVVNRPPVRRELAPKPRRPAGSHRQADTPSAPIITGSMPATPPAQVAPAAPVVAQSAPPTPIQVPASRGAPVPNAPPAAGAAAAAGVPASTDGQTAAAPPGRPADAWTAKDIELAKGHCTTVLRGVDAVMTAADPIKEGECGSPVVYRVSSIAKGPAVELSPPVTLTCDMVAALDRWLKQEVQPRARTMLGGAVVRIDTMSSYSCRNAYGRVKSKLSEHGKANAIDIAGFTTPKDTTTVLAGWGLTAREVRAVAARQEAERAAAAKAPPGSPLPQVVTPGGQRVIPNNMIPGVIVTQPVSPPAVPQSGLGLAPQRLGGPKGPEGKAAPAPAPAPVADNDPRRRFLREIHAAACRHFGTVLGPEANNAHKNHFHLDMAQRNRGSFCE